MEAMMTDNQLAIYIGVLLLGALLLMVSGLGGRYD